MVEFKAWPKISRFSRDAIITEKLDGTNACVIIEKVDDHFNKFVGCQSRSRLITPEDDNYGFAKWADANGAFLADVLGPGYHFGEWWGQGIQRGYNMKRKKFSLFNVSRWKDVGCSPEDSIMMDHIGLDVVPTLWQGTMDGINNAVATQMNFLKDNGSVAEPSFMNPEGIVIFHTANGTLYKKTFEKDEQGKEQ